MLGSKEEPYPGRVLISFWCESDILADIPVLLISAIIKNW